MSWFHVQQEAKQGEPSSPSLFTLGVEFDHGVQGFQELLIGNSLRVLKFVQIIFVYHL